MSTTPDYLSGDRAHANERPEATAPARPRSAPNRLSVPRQSPRGAFSPLMRHAFGEAARRASVVLAESAGQTADEIQAQLRTVVDVLPSLGAQQAGDSTADAANWNIPRRFLDVLRVELLATLDALEQVPDGRETISALTALEQAMRQCEATSTGRFVARLAGVESVNAVVEIAHDIRSPLSSILFLVDTIRRGQSGQVSSIQERQLGLVYGAALGLSTLSSDLIDAVRGDRLVDGRPVPFSITEVILGVCAIVQPIGEEKSLPVNVSLPAVDGRIGYASAINRVLLNLTTNALRYTDSGSVSIGCTEHGHEAVEFWVEDTGHGIPDNVLAMLFDGFRPGSVGIRFSSAGLGLAICRNLLEAMGSSLQVQTAPDTGTRFSFKIDLPVV